MRNLYLKEVKEGIKRTGSFKPEIIKDTDLQHLPPAVKNYLNYAGVVGKEKVINLRLKFDGRIRSNPDSRWMAFKAEQYSFFDNVTRAFYIEASMMGIPAKGLHLYKNGHATMVIKLAGLFKIVDAKGSEMDQGETVTVFNDMCFMAPATLINKSIEWEEIDGLNVRAKYTNCGIPVTATLTFNEAGELINFKSNDRFETSDGKTYNNYPWSTPARDYKDFSGYKLTSYASLFYHRPENDFCYGEFNLKEIEYNCRV